jgi:Na+/H+ antiporter NhaD/arsenite permease-like protein
MLPVITALLPGLGLAPGDNKAYLLYFGLLIGATLGGNITPVGASANITGIGMLRREGYEVKTSTFMKISVPFTLVAVLTGWILCFVIWGL